MCENPPFTRKESMHDFLLVTVAYRNVESETCWSVEKAHQQRLDNFMWVITGGDALIGRSRSHILTQFVRNKGMPPYFIFLDSDIVFEPEDLHRIAQDLKSGYDIIGGDYAVKSGIQSANYAYDGEYESDGKIHEIQFLSTGFMGIALRAAKDIAKKLKLPLLHEGTGHEGYPYFESGYRHVVPETKEEKGEIYISEDWDFCEKCRKAGYKVYLDTSVRLGHKGVQIMTMQDVVNTQAAMTNKTKKT